MQRGSGAIRFRDCPSARDYRAGSGCGDLDLDSRAWSRNLADEKGACRSDVAKDLTKNRYDGRCRLGVCNEDAANDGIGQARSRLAKSIVDRRQGISCLLGWVLGKLVRDGIASGRA